MTPRKWGLEGELQAAEDALGLEDRDTNVETGGGSRYSAGKPGRFWQGPLLGLVTLAPVWTRGGKKYAPLDWKEGQSFSGLIDCAFRHFLKMLTKGPLSRDDGDGGTGAYHAAAIVWNLLVMLTFIVLGRTDLDDVTPWHGVTASMVTQIAEANHVEREEVTAAMVREWVMKQGPEWVGSEREKTSEWSSQTEGSGSSG